MSYKILNPIFLSLILILVGCDEKKVDDQNKNFISDDIHKKIEIKTIPQRLITLAPNLTELVFELGHGAKIIGNTSYCNYPDSAKNISKVADLLTVNLEKISALKPDLIFITTEGNSKNDYNSLINLGFKVFVSNPRHYDGIKKTLLDMGKIFGSPENAEQIIGSWEERIEKVRANHDKLVYRTAMFLISTNPLFTVGKKSFLNQIITYAGLENITADSKMSYPMFNREEVLSRNPDYILLYETNKNDISELLKEYPEWHTLSAIISGRVFFINADLYSRPGPRFVEAVEDLHNLVLHH